MREPQDLEQFKFLTPEKVRSLAEEYPTPFYVYSRGQIKRAVDEIQSAFADLPYGLTIRYAMKANPHPAVLEELNSLGIHIDASSEYEARGALGVGVEPQNILLTSQQLPQDMTWIKESGVQFTATSLHQLEEYGKKYPSSQVSLRLNTGLGSGMNHRLTTGGIEVGFGIWFGADDDRDKEIHAITSKYDLKVQRIHIHIGTGSDPQIWEQLMMAGINALEHFEEATVLNLGGGFKLPYMSYEKGANLNHIGQLAKRYLSDFAQKSGRKIHFEVEPGRYLVARAGSIVSTIIDEADTGDEGDVFLKLDTGMTEIIRTSMYGSLHPLVAVTKQPSSEVATGRYVVIGHCCESSDILTTKPGDPESIEPRLLNKASIGDYMVIEMAGAYCASMSAKRYNSFPEAKEVIID